MNEKNNPAGGGPKKRDAYADAATSETPKLPKYISPDRLTEIAVTQAESVCAPGLPGALSHNTRTILRAMLDALEESDAAERKEK